jgi:hypothetical protein
MDSHGNGQAAQAMQERRARSAKERRLAALRERPPLDAEATVT